VRQVRLIALNFVREQRWPILVLMLWVVVLNLTGLVKQLQTPGEDVLFLFKQVAAYGLAFAVFFGASAIHNERKTRRILSVLSKSVGREQYIGGLLCGIVFALAIFCFAMALTGTWMLEPAGFPVARLWFLMLCLMIASVLAAAVAVLFSTFLNPLFATLSAISVMAIPAAAMWFDSRWASAIPVFSLVELLIRASFAEKWTPQWNLLLIGLLESGLCWVVASWIFSRRDIAVAVD
jgi:ABC-type transport system involved in multi-copper enzyme maturation permease subunit